MKNSRTYFVFILVALLLLAFFFLEGDWATKADSIDVQGAVEYAKPVTGGDAGKSRSVVSVVAEGERVNDARPKDVSGSRNPFSGNADKNGYEHYSVEELESLAEAGDVYAMLVLLEAYGGALQLMDSPEDIRSTADKIESMARRAVIYGDKQALEFVEENDRQAPIFFSEISTVEQKSEAMIDVLAFYDFAGMRGDLSRRFQGYTSFFDYYWPEKTSISTDEKRAIRNKAKEIYRSYEDERIELGLGPFDNTVDEDDEKYRFSLDDGMFSQQ